MIKSSRQTKDSYCLVLSGGGAKGIYHIGVWEALLSLDITIGACIGNSIGALIAGVIAMDDNTLVDKVGNMFAVDKALQLPAEFVENGALKLTTKNFAAYKEFYYSIIEKKGLDTSPLRGLVNTSISEDTLRSSGIDLGIVTFNISTMKPKEIFLEDMEEGSVGDYLLASSAFPGFQRLEIDGQKYMDGGVYDNIPYRMARRRGYRRIIVVDISGIGIKRKMNIQGSETIYIKNSINMGRALDFTRDTMSKFRKLGYLDTMRCFGRISGYRYFISENMEMEERFARFLTDEHNQEDLIDYAQTIWNRKIEGLSTILTELAPEYASYDTRRLLVFLDSAASVLSLERVKDWEYEELFETLCEQKHAQNAKIDSLIRESKNSLVSKVTHRVESLLKVGLDKDTFNETPYFYYRVIQRLFPKKAQRPALSTLCVKFPELPAGCYVLTYLDTLRDILTRESD